MIAQSITKTPPRTWERGHSLASSAEGTAETCSCPAPRKIEEVKSDDVIARSLDNCQRSFIDNSRQAVRAQAHNRSLQH